MCRQRRFFSFVRCLLFLLLLLLLIVLLLLLFLFARAVSQANGSTQRAHRQLCDYISHSSFSFIAHSSLAVHAVLSGSCVISARVLQRITTRKIYITSPAAACTSVDASTSFALLLLPFAPGSTFCIASQLSGVSIEYLSAL